MRPTRGAALCSLLSLAGIVLAGYLVFLHLGLMRGELFGGPACGTGVFNCHAVTAGSWSTFLGMPLALWGLSGYLAVFALCLLAWQSAEWTAHALTLTFLLSGLFVGIDVILFVLMAFVIRFYCVFCLLTYVVNLALLVVSGRSLARPWPAALGQSGTALAAILPSGRRPVTGLFWGLLLVAWLGVVALHLATTFVNRGTLGGMQQQIRQFVSRQSRLTVSTAGDPATGIPGAPIQVVEFSDFLCPACQRASKMNTIILANHRRDVQFVFKQYPLDTSCNTAITRMVHAGACQLAAASECAHLQGKFWALHDRMFEQGPTYKLLNLAEDARAAGLDVARFQACLDSGEGLEAVKRDIAEGVKFGISSTPTYLINGIPVSGGLTPAVFDEFVAVLQGKTGGR